MSSRILIVDDETNVRLNYRITLETEGYEVFEARSAASALEELLERSFAVAILDMRMPEMGGLELLAKMREADFGAAPSHPEPIRFDDGRRASPTSRPSPTPFRAVDPDRQTR
jgi:CheY-like chemotaxis protein